MHVAITGSTGLIGSSLVGFLSRRGHTITRLVRREPRADHEVQWDPEGGRLDPGALTGVDAVVHLAGEPIGAGRLTDQRKQRIRDSRVVGTRALAEALAGLDHGPGTLVCASGIHFYGHRGDTEVDEASEPGEGFLAGVVRDWEDAADPARAAGVRVVHLRTGIVQDPAGGALGRVLPIFKAGVGGRLGSGRQWWSWISRDDVLGLYAHALTDGSVTGPVNATAPNPVTNAEYTRVLARVLRRPAVIPVPTFAPKVLLGAELADELLFTSIKVRPRVAQQTGYGFHHTDLADALRELLGKPA